MCVCVWGGGGGVELIKNDYADRRKFLNNMILEFPIGGAY